jgi:hypothetical protein
MIGGMELLRLQAQIHPIQALSLILLPNDVNQKSAATSLTAYFCCVLAEK